MAILDKSMNPISVSDMKGSLTTIENYIRYMGERIEFSGKTTTALKTALTAAENSLETLGKEMQAMEQSITALEQRVTALENA